VTSYAKRRRSEGASWMTIAKELGACFETVRRWCVKSTSAVARVRPVEIVVDRAAVIAAATTLKVVTPNGLGIEGAGIEEVVALVRALG
jgi:orotate phosphoribosyltransferase-like protein